MIYAEKLIKNISKYNEAILYLRTNIWAHQMPFLGAIYFAHIVILQRAHNTKLEHVLLPEYLSFNTICVCVFILH